MVAGLHGAGEDAHVGDDAAVDVEGGIEDEGAQFVIVPLARGGDAMDDGLEDVLDADAGLGAGEEGLLGGDGEDFLELFLDRGDVGVRQIDLVDDRDDGEALLHREVDIGHGLGLDALGGIDDEEGAFAGGERAGDLVGEIDVAGGVEEVERVLDAVLGPVEHGDGVGLDGDAALALEVHRVEELVLGFALRDGAGELQQAVRERGLPVIDVGDDTEIPGKCDGH